MELKINQNLYMLSGQLGRDAEQKVTAGGKNLTSFSVAIGKKPIPNSDQTETVWRNVTCWRQLADSAASLRKGDTVLVFGAMSTREYQDRDGNMKTSETINAEAFFVTPPAHHYNSGFSAPQNMPQQMNYAPQANNYPPQNAMPYGQPQQPPYAQQNNGGFVPFESKEDLPF